MKKRASKFKIVSITVILSVIAVVFLSNFMSPHQELSYKIIEPYPVEDPRFAKSIGDLLDPAFVDGNKIKALYNGDEIFPAMIKAIQEAKSNITLESYIYWSGDTGKMFADLLAEKARAGVKVHVLLDWAGSGKISRESLDEMRAAGAEVKRYHSPRWYNVTSMNNRTHRKILTVDGRIGFTGGVGIADEWTGAAQDGKHWRDNHYQVEGPVVNQMQSAFMDNWLKTRPEVYASEKYFPTLKPQGTALSQMFISSAGEGGSSVRIMYLMALAGAKKSIYLESAYFVPDQHVISQLIEARKRGVEIKIIVPGPYGDSDVVDHASKELWGELLRENIKMYQYQPSMFHVKVLIIDNFLVSLGSTNFDERSFRLNDEANLNILDKDFAASQTASFNKDLAVSKEITFQEWSERPLYEKIMGKVMSLVSSQL